MPLTPPSNPTSGAPLHDAPPGFRDPSMPRADVSAGQRAALALLRGYKVLISPIFAGSCRFLPSCSDYAAEAVTRFGVARGLVLALRRLSRCHPLGTAGLDPVPGRRRRV